MALNVTHTNLEDWLTSLGYSESGKDVVRSAYEVSPVEPYAPELMALTNGSIDPAIAAVSTIDRTPTVCFVTLDPLVPAEAQRIAAVRRAIWNQNLVCLVLVVSGDLAYPYSAIPGDDAPTGIKRQDTARASAYSYREVIAGSLVDAHPDWFDRKNRVDKRLLANLDQAVRSLEPQGVDKLRAQYLLGQSLFISYLEHRGIAGSNYRAKHGVESLLDLISACDRAGLDRYMLCLKKSFNGDFLTPEVLGSAGWAQLSDASLSVISDFLSHTNISSGQQSLWTYDFRFIPVELISGIYETFLSEDKHLAGAYYTPRNLAAFVVDQAFEHSVDITKEIVYDGGCGSGILLVTAFRRMIHAAESAECESLTFQQRCRLLEGHIRGSDINAAACLVTAFSLYLSLLENLRPADLTLIGGDSHDAKLPKLQGVILWSGEKEGDFFSKNVAAKRESDATIFISNPPWREPRAEEENLSFERWASEPPREWHLPHRQIAAAFTHRALDVVQVGGRVCLILPAKLFLSTTSQRFVQQFLQRCQLKRIVCFADVRFVLFPEAVHPCVVVLAEKLPNDGDAPLVDLHFEYWVPKADVSIAYGRLTVHGCDRHELPLALTARNNQVLRTYLWGGPHDQALMLRLGSFGRLGDMVRGKGRKAPPRWLDGKGFHHKDKHVEEPRSTAPLLKMKFLKASSTPPLPVMDASLLQAFPKDFLSVASYGAHGGQLFKGHRVVLNDGVDFETFEAKAVYSSIPFSFQSSLGAFAGPDADEDLLRFLAVYLRSSLARYLLLMSSYALTVERQRVSMKELKELPFVVPDLHPSPEMAKRIIKEIALKSSKLEALDSLESFPSYEASKPEFDSLVAEYFGLTAYEIEVIKEASRVLIPSIQPAWSSLGFTPLSRAPNQEDLSGYVEMIGQELRALSKSLGGTGGVHVEVVAENAGKRGALAICRICNDPGPGRIEQSSAKVEAAIAWLRAQDLLPLAAGDSFNLTSDFLFFWKDEMFLVKPLISRFWLRGQARRDALRVVQVARQHARARAE
jgi:N-6 DNA Methylase